MVKSHYTVNLDAEIVAKLQAEPFDNPDFNASRLINDFLKKYFSIGRTSTDKEILLKNLQESRKKLEIARMQEIQDAIKYDETCKDEQKKETKESNEQKIIVENETIGLPKDFKTITNEEYKIYCKEHNRPYKERPKLTPEQIKKIQEQAKKEQEEEKKSNKIDRRIDAIETSTKEEKLMDWVDDARIDKGTL